jgi:resuscitation-promoting factor RpfA
MTTPLPPLDPRKPDEALPGEAELAALYRQLPQNEPGPALDAAVLRAAAQALEANGTPPVVPVERRQAPREPGDWVHPKPVAATGAAPAGSARKSQPRWLVGLSSAAALVLAVGLAWRMHESPRTESAPVASGSVAPVQAEAATNAPMPLAPLPSPPKQPPPRIIAAAPPAPMMAKSRQVVADKQAAPASRDEQLAGAAARAPADVTVQSSNEAATNAAKPAVAEAAASAPSMQATMAAAPAPVAARVDADTATNASDTPAQELDKIRQLFAQGHDDEAQQRLAAFQRAHPQWEPPPELQAKLRKP